MQTAKMTQQCVELMEKEARTKGLEAQDDTSTVATEDMSNFEDSDCEWEQMTEEQREYGQQHCIEFGRCGNGAI